MPGSRRAGPARCALGLPVPRRTRRPRWIWPHIGSFAHFADLAVLVLGVDRRGILALAELFDHGGASRRVDRAVAARLHQVRRVLHHGGHVALMGAAQIPIFAVLEIAAVEAPPDGV